MRKGSILGFIKADSRSLGYSSHVQEYYGGCCQGLKFEVGSRTMENHIEKEHGT